MPRLKLIVSSLLLTGALFAAAATTAPAAEAAPYCAAPVRYGWHHRYDHGRWAHHDRFVRAAYHGHGRWHR